MGTLCLEKANQGNQIVSWLQQSARVVLQRHIQQTFPRFKSNKAYPLTGLIEGNAVDNINRSWIAVEPVS
jgi:hypothetical protein